MSAWNKEDFECINKVGEAVDDTLEDIYGERTPFLVFASVKGKGSMWWTTNMIDRRTTLDMAEMLVNTLRRELDIGKEAN